MFKIIAIILSSFLTIGCTMGFSLGNKPVRDFESLKKSQKEKYVIYYCNFDNIVKDNFTTYGDFCSKENYVDYVAYFIAFDYQKYPDLLNNYIDNLEYQLSVNNLELEKKFLLSTKNDKMFPKSFVTSDGKNTAIFLSRQDLVLRSKIYPMLEVNGIIPPDNASEQLLSDYKIRYTVHPYVIDTEYSTDDIAKMLDVPLYSQSEYDIDNVTKTINYTKGLRVGKDNNSYLNQFLPPYELSSIEIYFGITLLKKYQSEDIIDLLFNLDEDAGLFFINNSSLNEDYVIRFNYVPIAPKYSDISKIRLENSGLFTIYANLGNMLSADMRVQKSHDIFSIPLECLVKAKVDTFLEGVGLGKNEQFKIINKFDRTSIGCSESELFLTNIIFGPRYDDFESTLKR